MRVDLHKKFAPLMCDQLVLTTIHLSSSNNFDIHIDGIKSIG